MVIYNFQKYLGKRVKIVCVDGKIIKGKAIGNQDSSDEKEDSITVYDGEVEITLLRKDMEKISVINKRNKKVKKQETNEEIRRRLKYQLDGSHQDQQYAAKILMGFEPLDDWNYISRVLEEREQQEKEIKTNL